MEVFRGAVSVTPSPPLDSSTAYLFYYAAVHPVAVAQSVVLSSILESSGDAQLPGSVSFPEFELWQKAVVDREVNKTAKKKVDADFGSFCAILKAADGVGDTKFDEWVSLAWSLLYTKLQPIVKSKDDEQDINSFLKLPDHIQHAVFLAGARKSEERSSLDVLLGSLPQSTHPSILTAFISPGKVIHAAEGLRSLPLLLFFQALSFLPADPPSIMSIVDTEYRSPCWNEEELDECAEAAASALLHHSALTSMQLSRVCSTAWRMKQLVPAIAALNGLKTLQLGSSGCRLSMAALSVLPYAFQSTQMLERLKVHVWSSKGYTGGSSLHKRATKRRCIEASSSAPDYPEPYSIIMLRLLSRLTRLTYLSIESSFPDRDSTDVANVTIPINMPHLEVLDLPGSYRLLLPVNILSNLAAPLKSANIEYQYNRCPQLQYPQQLCSRLQSFVNLNSLTLLLMIPWQTAESALCPHVSSMFSNLHQLRELKMWAPFPILCAGISSLVPRVTKLSCRIYSSPSNRDGENAFIIGTWQEFCAAMSLLALRHLQMSLPDEFQHDPLPGLAHLSALTSLTALILDSWGACLGHATDHEALAHMSGLHLLRISGVRPEHAVLPAVMDAMVSLPQLLELQLSLPRSNPDIAIPAVAGAERVRVPAGAWQNLTSLEFPVQSVQAASELIKAGIQLPALRRLDIQAAGRVHLLNRQRQKLQKQAARGDLDLTLSNFRWRSVYDLAADDSGEEFGADYYQDSGDE